VPRSLRLAHLSCFTNTVFVVLFEPRDVGHALSDLSWVNVITNTLFVALFEPRDVGHALSDSSWVNAMHVELENFERNQVWTLVESPRDVNARGTKWVFKNKQGEDGEIVRNKARIVAQGFSLVEGLDFGETFSPVACLEAIRILLVFATSKGFKFYQMDVKSAFLNGVIQDEVFVDSPQVLRTPCILIECTSYQTLCTGLSKRRGLGMLGLRHFC
jgi:hypothetical protein